MGNGLSARAMHTAYLSRLVTCGQAQAVCSDTVYLVRQVCTLSTVPHYNTLNLVIAFLVPLAMRGVLHYNLDNIEPDSLAGSEVVSTLDAAAQQPAPLGSMARRHALKCAKPSQRSTSPLGRGDVRGSRQCLNI